MRILDHDEETERHVGDDWTGCWGQSWQLLAVEDEGLLSATAVMVQQLHSRGEPELVRKPLRVTWFHPKFPLRKVGVLP